MPLDEWTALGSLAAQTDIPFHTALLQQLGDDGEIQYKERLRQYTQPMDYEDPLLLGSVEPSIFPILWPISQDCIELELSLRYKITGSADVDVGAVIISDRGFSSVIGQTTLSSTTITDTTITVPCSKYQGQDVFICLWFLSDLDSTDTKTTGDITSVTNHYLVTSPTTLGVNASGFYAIDFEDLGAGTPDAAYLPERKQAIILDTGSGNKIFIWRPMSDTVVNRFNTDITLGDIRTIVTEIGVINVFSMNIRETKTKTSFVINSSTLGIKEGLKPGTSSSPNRILPVGQIADRCYVNRTSMHCAFTSVYGYHPNESSDTSYFSTMANKCHRTRGIAQSVNYTVFDRGIVGVYDSMELQNNDDTTTIYPRRRLTVGGAFTAYCVTEPYEMTIQPKIVITDIDGLDTHIDDPIELVLDPILVQVIPVWMENASEMDLRAYVNGIKINGAANLIGASSNTINGWNTLQETFPLSMFNGNFSNAGVRWDLNRFNWYTFKTTAVLEDNSAITALLSDYKGDATNSRDRTATKKLERLLRVEFIALDSAPNDPAQNNLPGITTIDLFSWYAHTDESAAIG